jgi:hypothetical protein
MYHPKLSYTFYLQLSCIPSTIELFPTPKLNYISPITQLRLSFKLICVSSLPQVSFLSPTDALCVSNSWASYNPHHVWAMSHSQMSLPIPGLVLYISAKIHRKNCKRKPKKCMWRKKLQAKTAENSAKARNEKIFPWSQLILQEANAAKLKSEEFSGWCETREAWQGFSNVMPRNDRKNLKVQF